MAKTSKASYQAMANELNDILLELQAEDLDIDTAVKQYERGLELVKELEAYLKSAENTVSKLKAKFSD